MGNYFIGVGGTGQMVALAYWRFMHLLPWCKPAEMYYMDRDPIHTGYNTTITDIIGSLKRIDPLPKEAPNTFYQLLYDPAYPNETQGILSTLFTTQEENTPITTGMYGRPPVGASVLKSKLIGGGDGVFNGLLNQLNDGNAHNLVICGSAMGGTGAGGVPSLAQYIDQQLNNAGNRTNVRIYVFYFLKHFTLTDGGGTDGIVITPEQVKNNAESGLCYLADKIAHGINACFLMGLNNLPTRNYQDVGSQEEQSHFLHLLAALKAHDSYFQNVFPSELCAYAIDVGGLPINVLKVKLPGGIDIGFSQVLQINEAAENFLLLFKRVIEPLPGFGFFPVLPGNFIKILGKLERSLKKSKENICNEIGKKLDEEKNALKKTRSFLSNIIENARDQDRLFSFGDSDIVLTSGEYAKEKKSPMGFIRRWCNEMKIRNVTFQNESDVCLELKKALYRTLNKKFFNKKFGDIYEP